jgi:hypothetical protein
MIRQSIEEQARASSPDAVAVETLRNDIHNLVSDVRRSIDRAREFQSRGLVSEAAAIVEDFPDLARQAQALAEFPRSSDVVSHFWSLCIARGGEPLALPTQDEIDELAAHCDRARALRSTLDALRIAALRREPITQRLAILRKLRELDGRNRMWLDQIESLEKEWIKRIAEMRATDAPRQELEEAYTALSSREWIAPVPRGLKEELYAKLRPLRAAEAGDRYAELVARIHDAASLMDRAELERLEAAWAQIYHETGRMPDEAQQAAVAAGFDWLGRVAADERAAAEFDQLVDQLERALDARQPAVEIERQLAALRDSGRSAPDGVIARATSWIESERERARRKHRLVLVGSLAAALVLAGTGYFALAAITRGEQQRDAVAALQAAIDKRDSPAAHALAEQFRAKPELATPELSALIAREETLLAEWNTERATLQRATASLDAELAAPVARPRLKPIADEIARARAMARLKEEIAAIDALAAHHADREIERNAADAKIANDAMAAIDASLAAWPTPDRWTAPQQLDLVRWEEYAAALARAKGSVDRTLLDVTGAADEEARLKLKADGIDARISEAKTRRQELVVALGELSPRKIGAGVSSETVFIERLEALLATQGASLQRMGLLDTVERARDCGPAWRSIQAWRDEVRPRLDLAIGKQQGPDADADAAALQALQGFLASYPDTPYKPRVEELLRRLDPNAAQPIWSSERVRTALSEFFYADLEEVPMRGGDRMYYRRHSDADRDPLHRAVEDLADLKMNPDRLNAKLLKPGEQLGGPVRRSAVSVAWADSIGALDAAAIDETQAQLLALIERLRGGVDGDALFRLRALRDAAEILVQSGHAPAGAVKPIEEWTARTRRTCTGVLNLDWLRAAFDPAADARDLRRRAADAVADFPSLKQIESSAKLDRERAVAELKPLAPIGVLLPAEPGAADRAMGDKQPDGPAVVIARDAGAWKFVDITVQNSRVAGKTAGLPSGPVLVFRRPRS